MEALNEDDVREIEIGETTTSPANEGGDTDARNDNEEAGKGGGSNDVDDIDDEFHGQFDLFWETNDQMLVWFREKDPEEWKDFLGCIRLFVHHGTIPSTPYFPPALADSFLKLSKKLQKTLLELVEDHLNDVHEEQTPLLDTKIFRQIWLWIVQTSKAEKDRKILFSCIWSYHTGFCGCNWCPFPPALGSAWSELSTDLQNELLEILKDMVEPRLPKQSRFGERDFDDLTVAGDEPETEEPLTLPNSLLNLSKDMGSTCTSIMEGHEDEDEEDGDDEAMGM